MDENLSRGYVLLGNNSPSISAPNSARDGNNKWRYRYQRYAKSRASTQTTLVNASLSEEEEDYNEEIDLTARQPTSARHQDQLINTIIGPPVPDGAPSDPFHLIYIGLVLAGVGFLLPYNSFVAAVDYYQDKYPGTTIVFDMSFIYIIIAFGAVCFNNAIVELVPLYYRINSGYIISLITLVLVALCEVSWNLFPTDIGYKLNLISVAIVAFGCTIQQSSFYGYTSMLPARYTQAVMTGESAAGLIVSINRIITKFLISDPKENTLTFFTLSIFLILITLIVQHRLEKSDFVRFYVKKCDRMDASQISSNSRNTNSSVAFRTGFSKEDFGLVEFNDITANVTSDSNPARLNITCNAKLPQNVRHSDSTEFDMPFGIDDDDLAAYTPPVMPGRSRPRSVGHGHESLERTLTTTSDEVFILDTTNNEESIPTISTSHRVSSRISSRLNTHINLHNRLSSLQEFMCRHCTRIKLQIREMLEARSEVASLTAPLMAAIGIDYLVTLALFPGIESEVISCSLKSWMPVILMALFNLSDFVGKIIASLLYAIPPLKLLGFSCLRILLIPAFCFCVAPRHDPYLRGELFSMTLAVILGLSNGICGSLPMILAPSKVPSRLKEITGNLMTLSYSIGLTLGSLLAYLVDYGLGSSLTNNEIASLCNYNLISAAASSVNLMVGQSVLPNLINFSNNFTREYLIKVIQNQSIVDVTRINDHTLPPP